MNLSRRYVLSVLLFALLAAGVFVPGLGGGFIFDDKPNIVENGLVHIQRLDVDGLLQAAFSFEPGGGSRPLAMISFGFDYWRAGLNAASFKITNLIIHSLTIMALTMLFRRLFSVAGWGGEKADCIAFLCALMWGVHPLQVSTVLYVVQRMQMLGTLFLVLALWSYIGMRRSQMDGQGGRQAGATMLLFWCLACASKEDSVLLPMYAFCLEATVLRFRASDARVARLLRKGYMVLALTGVVVFLFVVIPHYWVWGAYPGRDFSSLERVLTQARVLGMYLLQGFVPWPGLMPFYYDDLVVSRGLFTPLSTFPALLVTIALLLLAWGLRGRQPLVCLGILLFFAGHFVSSNVLNLELAFEHRNSFPLIGLVLAFGVGFAGLWATFIGRRQECVVMAMAFIIAVLASATLVRAYSWGEPLRFAEVSVSMSPHSERAWLLLSGVYAARSRLDPARPEFDKAVELSQQGAAMTMSPTLISNTVVFKALRGDEARGDWQLLLARMREVPLNAQTRNILWVMLGNVDKGVKLDSWAMVELIDIVANRSTFDAHQNLRIGAYIHNETEQPGLALRYLGKAVELSPPRDPAIDKMVKQLSEAGRGDWVEQLEARRRR